MKFNVNKCKVMHYGFNNPSYEHLMNYEGLVDTEEEIDLGALPQTAIDAKVLITENPYELYHKGVTQSISFLPRSHSSAELKNGINIFLRPLLVYYAKGMYANFKENST